MSDELDLAAPEPVVPQEDPTPAPESAPAVNLVVTSKVKAFIRSKGLRSDGGLADAINSRLFSLLEEAAERAKADGRATVRPHDLAA